MPIAIATVAGGPVVGPFEAGDITVIERMLDEDGPAQPMSADTRTYAGDRPEGEMTMSKKGGNAKNKRPPKPPMDNKGPKQK